MDQPHEMSEDLQSLQEAACNPSILLIDPDFCYRKGFVGRRSRRTRLSRPMEPIGADTASVKGFRSY